ncbi:hypothetical protein [Halobacillus salinus]|uniref:Uncharacterized protein n=1 Tax=Halobacillus salinus TaxID=192814 RepID=A0A4Z0H3K4_9BACI|nr:hypothetical protein [Halobacillus salinus]TGB04680.1 hypothetical protein E4663_06730 [Halobacillus salinus]
MLKGFQENSVIIECNKCTKETIHPIANIVSSKNELGEYENIGFECPCGNNEIFNMNLPTLDRDVPLARQDKKEQQQRMKVNQFIMMVREDYIRQEVTPQ